MLLSISEYFTPFYDTGNRIIFLISTSFLDGVLQMYINTIKILYIDLASYKLAGLISSSSPLVDSFGISIYMILSEHI